MRVMKASMVVSLTTITSPVIFINPKKLALKTGLAPAKKILWAGIRLVLLSSSSVSMFSSLSSPSATLMKMFGGMSELATRYCSQSVVVMDGMLLLLKNGNLSR